MDKTIQPSLSSYCSNPILIDVISKLIFYYQIVFCTYIVFQLSFIKLYGLHAKSIIVITYLKTFQHNV